GPAGRPSGPGPGSHSIPPGLPGHPSGPEPGGHPASPEPAGHPIPPEPGRHPAPPGLGHSIPPESAGPPIPPGPAGHPIPPGPAGHPIPPGPAGGPSGPERGGPGGLDGTAPCLLYGYGAYESCEWPEFSAATVSLLDRGFVYAVAHVRGGGEGGRRWWLDGRLDRKRNTFTDFIAAADMLAGEGWVAGDRIVSRGLSAGGLLQGAVFSLAPRRWR